MDPLIGPEVLFSQGQTYTPFAGLIPFSHEEARTILPFSQVFKSSTIWFNTFRTDAGEELAGLNFTIDMEGISFVGDWRAGLPNNLEMSFQFQSLAIFPGIMDPFLSGFHKFFHLPNQSRETHLENQVDISLVNNGKSLEQRQQFQTALINWSLGLKYQWPFTLPGNMVLSTKGVIKGPVPEAEGFFLLNDWGLGASLYFSDQIPIILFQTPVTLRYGFSGGVNWLSDGPEILKRRPFMYQWGFHGGVSWGGGFWGVQGSVIQAPFDISSRFLGVRSGEIHMGVIQIMGAYTFEVALVEELMTWATLEVGLYTGVSFKW